MKFLLFIFTSLGIRLWFSVDQTGGHIIELKFGGRAFPVTADADPEIDLGGYKSTVESNGDGSCRQLRERKPAMIKGMTLVLDNDRSDLEFLQAKASANGFFDTAIVYANGAVYSGKMNIASDVVAKPKSATIELDFAGQTLKKQ